MGQWLHWEGNGGEQGNLYFTMELYIYIYIYAFFQYPYVVAMVMHKCLGAIQVCFYHILDSSFALPCCYFLLLTSSIWKKDTMTDISASSFGFPFTLHEITQCVYGGMGLLYENGNLSLSLSSLTEHFRQQRKWKGAIIFWSKH